MYQGTEQVRMTALQTTCTTCPQALHRPYCEASSFRSSQNQQLLPSHQPRSARSGLTIGVATTVPIPARPADNKILASSVAVMDPDVQSTQYAGQSTEYGLPDKEGSRVPQ